MSHIEILFLALALSIDALVVSFTYGLAFSENRTKNSLCLACSTGLGQAVMPCIGYFLTGIVKTYIAPYSSIIIFTIFLFLGLKFIKDAFDKNKEKPKCISLSCLILIGIATSIDAFSSGITLALSGNTIIKPAILIGSVTFINSIFGFSLGNNLKHLQSSKLEILAGIVLIILGIKAII